MKQRIKIDGALALFFALLTFTVYKFPQLYFRSHIIDNTVDFLGVNLILLGVFFRMVGRGYKKSASEQGEDLVTGGPYALVRNPMYLGTFTVGLGFVMILWPLWAAPIFALFFYLRFLPQVRLEEEHLQRMFGRRFEDYMARVPRYFPRFRALMTSDFQTTLPLGLAWGTQEKRGLYVFPLTAFILENLKEWVVFGQWDPLESAMVFTLAITTFSIGMWWEYQKG